MDARRAFLRSVIAISLSALSACSAGDQTEPLRVPQAATGAFNAQGLPLLRNPLPDDAPTRAAGAQVYASYSCAACHGERLEGGLGPSLVNTIWAYGSDDTTLFFLIRDGSKALRAHGYHRLGHEPQQGEMPPFASLLREQQIWEFIVYLRAHASTAD